MKDAWRIAALLIPSSVLKPASKLYIADHTINCSPPNTVIGIETSQRRTRCYFGAVIAALLIPSSVLKLRTRLEVCQLLHAIAALLIPSSVLKQIFFAYLVSSFSNCSPPNTVIGIETSMIRFSKEGPGNCSPPNTVIGIETLLYEILILDHLFKIFFICFTHYSSPFLLYAHSFMRLLCALIAGEGLDPCT